MGIDWYRKKNKTALNQSAAPVAEAEKFLKAYRRISINENSVVIEDKFKVHDIRKVLDITAVFARVTVDQAAFEISGLIPSKLSSGKHLTVRKEFLYQNQTLKAANDLQLS